MSSVEEILRQLRGSGERVTVARRAIIRLLTDACMPITAVSILHSLKEQGVSLNKTTVYRELKFLETKNLIRAMQFDERNKRYELTPDTHKHHLICTNCKRIEDVVLEHDLDQVERKVTQQKSFKVQRHALEFYGLCGECQV